MYEITEDTNESFILKEVPAAERMRFVHYRVVPLLLFLSAIVIFQQLFDEMPMGWVYLQCIVLIGIASYLLLQKQTGYVSFTTSQMRLMQHSLFGDKEISISNQEIKNINFQKGESSSGRNIFTLYTDKKRVPLLRTNDAAIAEKFSIALQKFFPGKLS